MKHRLNDRATSGRFPELHREHPVIHATGIAALLGGAAILALSLTEPLRAQTTSTDQSTTTDQTQAPAAMKEEPETQAAEPGASEPAPMDGQIVEQPEGTIQMSKVIGAKVAAPEGEAIGEINDVLFDQDNRLVGFVIGIGGFLGFGEKAIAVEAEEVAKVTTADGSEQLILNYTLEQLEQSPEFVSLDEQRQAEIDRSAREAQLNERQQAEEAPQSQQQPATTEPTQ